MICMFAGLTVSDTGQTLNHVTETSVKEEVFTGCLKHVQTVNMRTLCVLGMEMVI